MVPFLCSKLFTLSPLMLRNAFRLLALCKALIGGVCTQELRYLSPVLRVKGLLLNTVSSLIIKRGQATQLGDQPAQEAGSRGGASWLTPEPGMLTPHRDPFV